MRRVGWAVSIVGDCSSNRLAGWAKALETIRKDGTKVRWGRVVGEFHVSNARHGDEGKSRSFASLWMTAVWGGEFWYYEANEHGDSRFGWLSGGRLNLVPRDQCPPQSLLKYFEIVTHLNQSRIEVEASLVVVKECPLHHKAS